MDKAPERIWATEDAENSGEDSFHSTRPFPGGTEYFRKDLYADAFALGQSDMRERAAEARGLWIGFNSCGEPDASYCTVQPHDDRGMYPYIAKKAIQALPLTGSPLAAALKLPEVKALVEAATKAADLCHEIEAGNANAYEVLDIITPALAAIKEASRA